MKKYNNLYEYITLALLAVWKSNRLKKEIAKNPMFRQLVIKQIGLLFWLEKEHDTTYEEEKYALVFAQGLADISLTTETITKASNLDFNEAEEQYIDFVNFISREFKIPKADLKNSNQDISSIIINDLSEVKESEKTKAEPVTVEATTVTVDDDKVKAAGQNQPNTPDPFEQAPRNQGPAQFDSQGSYIPPGSTGSMNGIQFPNNVPAPVNPIYNQRFYPYTKKIKQMPSIKAILFGLLVFLAIIVITAEVISYFYPYNLNSIANGYFYKDSDGNPTTTPGSTKWSGQILLRLPLASDTFLSGIFILLAVIFSGYVFFGRQRFYRQKYVLSISQLVIIGIVGLFIIIMFARAINPDFNSALDNSIKGDSSPNRTKAFNIIVNYIHNSSTYKLAQVFTIIGVITAAVLVVGIIFLVIVAPKIDRRKLQRANLEYQKALQSAINGKQYQYDESLFDKQLTIELQKMTKEQREKYRNF